METNKLIIYLQDIVDLETQKRIAGNTYNRLLIAEKDNAYVHNTSIQDKRSSPSILKNIKWLPLIGKIYIGFLVEALAALLFKWTIVFAFMCIGIDIESKLAENFFMIVCGLAGTGWIIRREVLNAQRSIQQEKDAQIRYKCDVEKGKLILEQIQKDKPNLKKVYSQCKKSLEKLYALNIVHSDYQYLEACGMFLQYLNTGRTHCLEQRGGDIGAYNLYENDLKYNVIKKQLDQVLRNQQLLYGVLIEINNNVENLCSSVEKIEKYSQQTAQNTKISAWCNAVTAANTYALRRMQEEYIFYRR